MKMSFLAPISSQGSQIVGLDNQRRDSTIAEHGAALTETKLLVRHRYMILPWRDIDNPGSENPRGHFFHKWQVVNTNPAPTPMDADGGI